MNRKSEYGISPMFLERWSPRSFTGEPIRKEELMSFFEAARWSPSSYNNQPWRFLYALRDSKEWPLFFNPLVEFNQSWVKNASALICVISKNTFDHNGKPAETHSFDAGAAWMALALEANARNWVAHGMQGFDYEQARLLLHIPDDYTVEIMIAIGKQAPPELLPQELRAKEVLSNRKPLSEIVIHGRYISS